MMIVPRGTMRGDGARWGCMGMGMNRDVWGEIGLIGAE